MADKTKAELQEELDQLKQQLEDANKKAEDAEDAKKRAEESEKNLEAQIRKEEKSLKQQLEEMPKRTIEIPEDPNNPDDVVPVGWNGIIYAIPRGIAFEVPEVIYDIWKESHKKTQEVNKRIRESVKKEITVI